MQSLPVRNGTAQQWSQRGPYWRADLPHVARLDVGANGPFSVHSLFVEPALCVALASQSQPLKFSFFPETAL